MLDSKKSTIKSIAVDDTLFSIYTYHLDFTWIVHVQGILKMYTFNCVFDEFMLKKLKKIIDLVQKYIYSIYT